MLTIKSKYQPVHHTSALARPPNLSRAGRPSPQLTADLVYTSSWTSGCTCPPDPCPAFILLQNLIPSFHPLQQLVGSLRREGQLGELMRYYMLTLNIFTYPTPSTASLSTNCVQGTCLSVKININKPLYNFILLSFKLCNFCIPPATYYASITTL